MADLSENEVLSILNRMDAEQRTMESLQTARKYVRDVIEKYQAIKAELPTLEKALAEFNRIKTAKQIETDLAIEALDAQVAEARATISEELATRQARIDEAEAQAQAAEAQAAEKEAFTVRRGEQLDEEIQAKVTQLREAEAAMVEFVRVHALGA